MCYHEFDGDVLSILCPNKSRSKHDTFQLDFRLRFLFLLFLAIVLIAFKQTDQCFRCQTFTTRLTSDLLL